MSNTLLPNQCAITDINSTEKYNEFMSMVSNERESLDMNEGEYYYRNNGPIFYCTAIKTDNGIELL